MDPLQLLTRSSKRPNSGSRKTVQKNVPSTGPNRNPQLYGEAIQQVRGSAKIATGLKRKRGSDGATVDGGGASLNFFGEPAGGEDAGRISSPESETRQSQDGHKNEDASQDTSAGKRDGEMSVEERRAILKRHKLKISILTRPESTSLDEQARLAKDKKKKKKRREEHDDKTKSKKGDFQLYPEPVQDFQSLRSKHNISKTLARNIAEQGYTVPTEVQMAALPILLGSEEPTGSNDDTDGGIYAAGQSELDLLTVAPTGSGKTLAFMIPLIHSLGKDRQAGNGTTPSPGPKAIILAPTKELANQIVNEGRKLSAHAGISITLVRKGMHLGQSELANEQEKEQPAVKSDILVSTPLALVHAVEGDANKSASLHGVRYLVLDEADVLLDPLFREQTLAIWNGATNPALRISLWSATMGSNIEELTKTVISTRRQAISDTRNAPIPAAPLIRLVVGLRDSAVPNIDHRMTYAATEQGKLMALREILHPKSISTATSTPLRAPFLVFTQTIERAVALHSELLYDIPPEAGGISRIAVLHSDLSDTARDRVMAGFRKGDIWVLITTDLLSRGVDFRGVNGVVNYDLPTSSAAYIHRVGRTGRAGREGGVAVTLYTKEDIPYVKNVANVIAAAEKVKGKTEGEGEVPRWLLDALPDVSKEDKKMLKKRGVEARRSGKVEKGKGAKTRISTKSGFERRQEGNRRGAIQATRRQMDDRDESDGSTTEFGGFED